MDRWRSAGSNWVWACRGGVRQGVGSLAGMNWVWACTGEVRQDRTGCGHAEVEFSRIELGVGMQRWSSTGCGHAEVEFGRIKLGVGMQR
jgi:hypothetical protein